MKPVPDLRALEIAAIGVFHRGDDKARRSAVGSVAQGARLVSAREWP